MRNSLVLVVVLGGAALAACQGNSSAVEELHGGGLSPQPAHDETMSGEAERVDGWRPGVQGVGHLVEDDEGTNGDGHAEGGGEAHAGEPEGR